MDVGVLDSFHLIGKLGIELVEPVFGAAVRCCFLTVVIERIDQREYHEFAIDARVIDDGEHLTARRFGIGVFFRFYPSVLTLLHVLVERLVVEERQLVAGICRGVKGAATHLVLLLNPASVVKNHAAVATLVLCKEEAGTLYLGGIVEVYLGQVGLGHQLFAVLANEIAFLLVFAHKQE